DGTRHTDLTAVGMPAQQQVESGVGGMAINVPRGGKQNRQGVGGNSISTGLTNRLRTAGFTVFVLCSLPPEYVAAGEGSATSCLSTLSTLLNGSHHRYSHKVCCSCRAL